MNKRLAWIAAVSLSLSAACVVLAVLTWPWVGGDGLSWAATTRSCAARLWGKTGGDDSGGARGSRTVDLEWQGSDAVKVNIPAQVHYQPGPKAQASISGDAELVSHVRMHGGTIEWDMVANCYPGGDLVVRLTGPAVPAWTLNGSGELNLSGVKQDALRITMRGSGTVVASGEVHEASLDIAGSGNADLGKLLSQQANARIRGSAEADLAAREDADISIAGSGIVRVHGAGARIHSHVSGSGVIKQVP